MLAPQTVIFGGFQTTCAPQVKFLKMKQRIYIFLQYCEWNYYVIDVLRLKGSTHFFLVQVCDSKTHMQDEFRGEPADSGRGQFTLMLMVGPPPSPPRMT